MNSESSAPSVMVAFVVTATDHKASMRHLIDTVIRKDITVPQNVVDTLNTLNQMAEGRYDWPTATFLTSDLDQLEELGCIRPGDLGIELL